MNLTDDQKHIQNVAINLIAANKQAGPLSDDLTAELVKVCANAFIDLNRAANAMEAIATFMAHEQMAKGNKSSIIKPGG